MQTGSVYPLAVTLRNDGPSLNGILQVRASTYMDSVRAYDYPLSLPSGAIKTVITYPVTPLYTESIDIVYSAGRQSAQIKLPVAYRGDQSSQIGLVGDEIGGLAGIPQDAVGAVSNSNYSGSASPVLADCYASPEAAPDRSTGYDALRILVLTDGCERLAPSQWQAIEEWTLSGGSLILLGGAGATYLASPAAQDLIPIEDPTGMTIGSLKAPGFIKGTIAGPVALTTGPVKAGAVVLVNQDNHVLVAEQRFGAGTVLFEAFNPLDDPLKADMPLLQKLIAQASDGVAMDQIGTLLAPQTIVERPYYGSVSYPPGATVDYSDPFEVRLPPVSTIAWIFLAYFLLAAPGSYFILRRIGKLNLAWVIGPVLSISCAFIFYLFTINLYQAGLSRRTSGVVVVRAGSQAGLFEGDTELFFPRGGQYGIHIPGALSLETAPVGNDDYAEYSSDREAPLETVDDGDVEAPGYSVTNLAFRRLYYSQPIDTGGQITTHLRRASDGDISGLVTNGTDWTIDRATLLLPDEQAEVVLGPLAPGKSVAVGDLRLRVVPQNGHGKWLLNPGFLGSDELDRELYRRSLRGVGPSGVYLVGMINGSRFGPGLGSYVGQPASIGLFVSVPLAEDEWRGAAEAVSR